MANIISLSVPKVLLVEDSKGDALLIEKYLNPTAGQENYKLTCTTGVRAAVEAIAQESYDVALLDLTLPDAQELDGLTSLQSIAPNLPIIMLTAYSDEALALKAVEIGAQDYMMKDGLRAPTLKRAIKYAIQRKQFEGHLIAQANFDSLTQLANRTLFESRLDMGLARIRRSKGGLAVFFLDLNRFKQVNDSMGHIAGDELLRQVSARLTQSMRPYDTIARMGGDEFAILVEGIENARECASIAHKIIRSLMEPFIIENKALKVGVSIGIAVALKGGESLQRMTLLDQADKAMYNAKVTGYSDYCFYTKELHDEMQARSSLENELRNALNKDELVLFYQPRIDLQYNEMAGAEALIRWNHPQRGLLLPAEFTNIAEETGFIYAINKWVMRRVFHDIKSWQDANLPRMQVSVNISGVQLDDDSFADWVMAQLLEHSISPEWLVLEIPTSLLTQNMEVRMETLGRLDRMGIPIQLDNFGVGMISMQWLHTLPIDAVKISPSITMNLKENSNALTMIRAIIKLAHHFGIKVIATGVENEWQRECLKGQNCQEVQGYNVSKPMPVTSLEDWVHAQKI